MVVMVYIEKANSNRIISFIKARVKVTIHKYGIEISTSIKHAKRLDKKKKVIQCGWIYL